MGSELVEKLQNQFLTVRPELRLKQQNQFLTMEPELGVKTEESVHDRGARTAAKTAELILEVYCYCLDISLKSIRTIVGTVII